MTAAKRVLVAEDEAMIGIMVEDFLDMLGYEAVTVCASVAECQGFLDGDAPFDLAVLDCHLNDGPVWPFARRLQEKGIPFIFASGNDGHGIPSDLVGWPTLGKPFSGDALGRALRRLEDDRQG